MNDQHDAHVFVVVPSSIFFVPPVQCQLKFLCALRIFTMAGV